MHSRCSLAFALIAVGCTPPGTRPHDMSAREHIEAARAEDEAAERHACGSPATAEHAAPCWTDDAEASEAHRAEMDEHRRLAAAHRAASDALLRAEERACVGVPQDARDSSPFEHRADVQSVTDLDDEQHLGRAAVRRPAGVVVVLRAVPALTAEWLERVIECHLARNAAVGHDMPEMAYCPLVPRGVTATVRSVRAGFAVEIRADSREGVDEIRRRARLLVVDR